ncbi:hypothetical protein DERP_010337 [Dermatophagoides pteronyssinus]|nr:hypothetical protein DERP_010337 [Dermatophagoides pteronyssinus]
MADYISLKSSDKSDVDQLDSPSIMTDSGNHEFNDFKSSESLVTFNKTKMIYSFNDELWAHFSVFLSSYKMSDEDHVGICRLPDDTFIVSKLIRDCEVDAELENLDDIGLLDDDKIIAKKTCFNPKDLQMDNNKKPVYFQFCYQNVNGDILGKSTPFQIKDLAEMQSSSMSPPQMIESTATTSGVDRPDEEDFIVVRSQESFLKERIEHLTKSNNLLQYLIRNMEKDIVDKENENKELNLRLNSTVEELQKIKKAHANSVEELEYISHQRVDLDTAKSQLEETLRTERELRRRLEKELSEMQITYKDYDKDLKESRENVDQLQAILLQKEDDISLAQDMVANLRKANTELLTKVNSLEDDLESTKSTLAKTLDERRALMDERSNWQTSMKTYDESKNYLIQRVEELEKNREKQSAEIKSLEEELRQSISNLKNINSKSEKEQSYNQKKEQDLIIKIDKLNADYIEMRARLEQAKVEYGNLFVKYQNLQKKHEHVSSKRDKSSTMYPKLPSSDSFRSNSFSNADNLVIIDDPVDRILNEMDSAAQNLVNTTANVPSFEEVNEIPIQSSSAEQQTMVKTLATEPSAPQQQNRPQQKDNDDNDSIRVRSIIDMPCTMCEEVIRCKQTDESGQMKEMIEHFENVHKQKMCPVCSVLFDTRLSIFKSYFSTHLQNHFNQMKYPSTSSSSK